ncbi:hypothetical protein B484DRAFT_394403 [Ochromonadaceae sp. CCMP2298]|nr:hypothetical protein B484DRAFT_394403 [Ochromonadaceae sp. CCMP2298]
MHTPKMMIMRLLLCWLLLLLVKRLLKRLKLNRPIKSVTGVPVYFTSRPRAKVRDEKGGSSPGAGAVW